MSRLALPFVLVVASACTGGPGPIDNTSGSSSGGSSSGGSSSGGSSSGGSSSGGSNGGTISASEVSQACVDVSDCIAVFQGNICDPCSCPNAAIAKSAASEYSAKRVTTGCPEVACAADCAEVTPTCAGGTCSITPR